MQAIDRVCIVVKQTPLEGLVRRYGTKDQARFVLKEQASSFAVFERFDTVYRSALEELRAGLPSGTRSAIVDFQYLPTYQFDPNTAVVTVGPDGLVANAAKYLRDQPLIAVNPDPATIDGVLARNSVLDAVRILRDPRRAHERRLSMAQATLADGQTLLAVNDLFIGQRTHVSARYELEFRGAVERQSSSGIIVSTGAGSTGWRRSILTGAARIVAVESRHAKLGRAEEGYAFSADARKLAFAVREPFISRASSAEIVAGVIEEHDRLVVTSQMAQNGVIFSDGVEADFLDFNGGATARIGLADRHVRVWNATR
jgi:hypothetical protein